MMATLTIHECHTNSMFPPQLGRKLVYRSEPPVLKRKHKDSQDKKDKEEEDLQYFFS